MSRRVDWPVLVLAAVVVVSVGVNLWWLHKFRAGYPLDIDESRYLSFGLSLRDGLAAGGPASFWHLWTTQREFGPLLPLVSVPMYLVFGRSVLAGLGTQLIFCSLLIVSSYGIGARLTSRAGGLLTALIAAGTPTLIDFSRSYQFALTDAAVMAAATWALLASDGFNRRGPSLAWGVFLGLMPLARTMALAFVPAQAIAAAWLVTSRTGRERVRLVNLLLALVLGTAVAATWLATSLHSVFGYLTNFGYGTQSSHFSQSGSRLSIAYWTREATNAVREDLYLPLAALLAVSLLLALFAAIARRGRTVPVALRRWVMSDGAIVCFILLAGYVAVSSSRNEGVGFRLPLLPLLAALAVAALYAVPWRTARRLLVGGLVVVSAVNVLMKADVVGGLSEEHSVHLTGLGTVPVVRGQGYIQDYVLSALRMPATSSTEPLPPSQRGWLPAYARVVQQIFGFANRQRATPVVRLATDEALLNANDFTLAARLHHRTSLSLTLLPPAPPGSASITAYERMLREIRPAPNVLVTVTYVSHSYLALTGLHDFDQGVLESAATSLGFTCGAGIGLPDGRTALVSWRTGRSAGRVPPASCVPRVRQTSPSPGSVHVPVTSAVSAVFALPMEATSVIHGFALTNATTGERVRGVVITFGETAVAFRPLRPLAPHTVFMATLSGGVRAAAGDALGTPKRWSFTTGG